MTDTVTYKSRIEPRMSKLGMQLLELREKAIAKGMKLLNEEEIAKEVISCKRIYDN